MAQEQKPGIEGQSITTLALQARNALHHAKEGSTNASRVRAATEGLKIVETISKMAAAFKDPHGHAHLLQLTAEIKDQLRQGLSELAPQLLREPNGVKRAHGINHLRRLLADHQLTPKDIGLNEEALTAGSA